MAKDDNFDINSLLDGLFKPHSPSPKQSLKDLFSARLRELSLNPTNVLDILKIQYRTLNGILNGTQKTVDYTNFLKLATFLQLPREEVIALYLNELERNLELDQDPMSKIVEFIKENFDLVALKKAGFIKSISNFREIEHNIKKFFGLKSIFDYKRPESEIVFSESLIKPRNDLSRSMWIRAAADTFKEINNPYQYNRNELIDYFPEIRWHSMNVRLGLTSVIKRLYKMGISVIYQAPLPSLHLRGATFSVNNRPSVVITDYRGFYPTLWFALVHELHHILFDWDEILESRYHISDPESEDLSVVAKEKEANQFAREYFLSTEKLNKIRPFLFDADRVKELAELNHVHESFVYVFHAYEAPDPQAWSKAKKFNPYFESLKSTLENPWKSPMPITDFVNSIKNKYYL